MDESVGSLDEITRTAMRYELLRVWERLSKTVILVTHSIVEAVMMSDRVIVLSTRPGRLLGQVIIDLPRPREEALERTPAFLKLSDRVREVLALGTKHATSSDGERTGA